MRKGVAMLVGTINKEYVAAEKRAAGKIVELSPSEETREEAARRQTAKGYRELIFVE